MNQTLIDRINELARKEKAEGLSPEEKKEQAALREQYIVEYRAMLRGILDNPYVQRPDGTKEKLKKSDQQKPLS